MLKEALKFIIEHEMESSPSPSAVEWSACNIKQYRNDRNNGKPNEDSLNCELLIDESD